MPRPYQRKSQVTCINCKVEQLIHSVSQEKMNSNEGRNHEAVHEENRDAEIEEAEEQTEQASEEAVETSTEPKKVNGSTLTFPNLDDIPNKERPPRVGKPPTRRGGMKKLRRERECLLAAGAVLLSLIHI